jgi:hypothetical protein
MTCLIILLCFLFEVVFFMIGFAYYKKDPNNLGAVIFSQIILALYMMGVFAAYGLGLH